MTDSNNNNFIYLKDPTGYRTCQQKVKNKYT